MINQFIGKTLAEKYRIDSLMRTGDSASLFRGTHLLMDKPVAVKVLSPSLAGDKSKVKDFADEARAISRIFHPNILNVTDYGSDNDGTVYIVFEDAEGQTLKEVLAHDGPLPLERANHIFGQVAAAVSAAHAQGVKQLNLRSDNILIKKSLSDGDAVKLLGFGANPLESSDSDDGVPTDMAAYLSPEQCAQGGVTDTRSDIYSLGVIFFEMLAGEVPFKGETATATMLKHTDAIPPQISAFREGLPNEVEEIALTALSKNPDSRYQSPAEFADAVNHAAVLAGSLDEEVTFVSPSRPISPLAEPVPPNAEQNNLWKTAFIVLAGITLLSAGFIYMTSVKQTNPTTQLQADANGMPVQPVNPPNGTLEQNLANMSSYTADMANSNMMGMPPGGDNYDPWANPSSQPSGQGQNYPLGSMPYQVQPVPGGTVITLDPGNTSSPFMGPDYTTVVVPANSNANVAPRPTPTKGKGTSNTNTATPAGTPGNVKPTPAPSGTPSTAPGNPADKGPTERIPVKPTKPAKTPKPASGEETNG